MRDMNQGWLTPTLKATNAAATVSRTDPVRACALAKEALGHVERGQKEIDAMETRLRAEGKELGPLIPLRDHMVTLKPQIAEGVEYECAPREAEPAETDPDAVAMEGYMRRYGAAVEAIQEARARQDRAGVCAGVKEVGLAVDDIVAALESSRAEYSEDADTVAQIDDAITKARSWKTNIQGRSPECLATGG